MIQDSFSSTTQKEFAEWLPNNLDYAEKHFPGFMRELKKRIQSRSDYDLAYIIEKIPDYFTIHKPKIDQHLPKAQQVMIQSQIDLIKTTLKVKNSHFAVQESLRKVTPILKEQLEFWIKKLKDINKPSKTAKKFTDYFQVPNKKSLARSLKKEFKTEKGKNIKILIEVLKEKQIIAVTVGELNSFVKAMGIHFGEEIKYESVRKYKNFGLVGYEKDDNTIRNRVNNLLNR